MRQLLQLDYINFAGYLANATGSFVVKILGRRPNGSSLQPVRINVVKYYCSTTLIMLAQGGANHGTRLL